MVTVADAIDQWAPSGVHVLPAERQEMGLISGAVFHRTVNRLNQMIVRRFVQRWASALDGPPETVARELARARAMYRRADRNILPSMEAQAEKTSPPLAANANARTREPPVPADWFAPKQKNKSRGVVFYVHGGSFIVERSPRITSLVARFAAAANARVFAPNYRLAPEHPCPAAVDDVVSAYRWYKELWPDEPLVALAESAGASILLASLQILRDAGVPLPGGIVLLSPWVDLSLQSWSVVGASLAGTTPYTMESLALMAHLYLGGHAATDPVASPLYGDFAEFPPMLIHASKGDILFDDALRLAERVRKAAGNLTVRFWADETHVWERMHSVKARESISFAAKFIRQRLDG
jgi:acetyl esterase/lipase